MKRRLYIGSLLVVAATAGWWYWSQRTAETEATGAKLPQPFVRVNGGAADGSDRILQERAEFFDPAPLFVPTSRNYSQGALPSRLVKQPGQVFGDFGAKLSFRDGGLDAYGAENLTTGEGLVEVLGRSNEVPFAGMGESGVGRTPLAKRSALMQIKRVGGSDLREVTFAELAVPQADFSPLELVVAVGPDGLIGDPVLVAGSGRDDVDTFFQDFVAKTYRLGTLLSPGRYRVMIGP